MLTVEQYLFELINFREVQMHQFRIYYANNWAFIIAENITEALSEFKEKYPRRKIKKVEAYTKLRLVS